MAGPIKPIASSAQIALGLEGEPEQLQRKKPADPGYKEVHEKYNPPEKDHKGKAAENKEFADKRQPQSPLIAKAEIERMKEILDKPRGGGGGGGGGIGIGGKLGNRDLNRNGRAGGKVNASSRADGCAMRGKTRGRIV
jgi:hypothetical protein